MEYIEVLKKTNDYAAYGLYCYLRSLPINCKINDEMRRHLKKMGGIGSQRLSNLIKILKEHGFIRFTPQKAENGRFTSCEFCSI